MAFTTEEEEKRPRNLAIPMKLDAFVFNRSLCTAKDKEARIVPITQYNYTFLRMEDHIVQSDLLPHADLHYSARPETNPRFTDLGRQTTRTNRLDVYLHWVLPRAFRSGTAGTPIQDKRQPEATAKGISDKVEDPKAPVFPQAPNRWLVVRRLDPNTTELKEASIQPVEAWIIESDRMRTIDKLGPEVDVQVDVALFITSYLAEGQDPSKVETKKQAEVFIGVRTPYHCGNVFSMLDTFSYVKGKDTKTLKEVRASYYVVGWQSKLDKDLLNISEGTRGDRLQSL
ncbi:hypothetical protein ACMFMG_004759 [Clarireedia jacksonii]